MPGLSLALAYKLLSDGGFPSEAQVVRASFPRQGVQGVRARKGLAVEVLQSKGLFDKFVSECWPYGKTESGQKYLERYKHCYDALKGDSPEPPDDDAGAVGDTFAYETDLRDYLAKNLSVIEPGMSLWPVQETESAVEFRVDGGRRIDILAKGRNGAPVVIELKVSSGHDRVIGQALYYRGCVKEGFGAREARIIIIAREITPELKIATRDLPNVELFEYRLAVNLIKISVAPSTAAAMAASPSN
jgi:hypothetical protein